MKQVTQDIELTYNNLFLENFDLKNEITELKSLLYRCYIKQNVGTFTMPLTDDERQVLDSAIFNWDTITCELTLTTK
jgi:hypothetical protein